MGKDSVADLCLVSLLSGAHVPLTDVPGVGKTTLARAITPSIAARPYSMRTSKSRAVTNRMKLQLPGLTLPELNRPAGRKRPLKDSVELRARVLAAVLVGERFSCASFWASLPASLGHC